MVKPGTTISSPSSSTLLPIAQSSENSNPKYKGVRKRKWGKWVSEIRLPNSRERIWLGSYDSPEKAARAFDAALYCLRGRSAKFNFPNSPPDIIGGQSLTPQEIQAVASRFASEHPTPPPPPPRPSGLDNSHVKGESSSNMMEHYTSSSSEGGGVQMDSENAIDWSFLDALNSNQGGKEFELYSGLDNIAGDYYSPPPPPPPPPVIDDVDDNGDGNGDQEYTQSSFLWNF